MLRFSKKIVIRFILLNLVYFMPQNCFSQRYTGYGRGLGNDSFNIGSPDLEETIVLLIVAAITLSIAGVLVKINENQEGKLSNVLTALTFVFGIIGVMSALALAYSYWYIVIIIVLGIALYGAYKDKHGK